jgi:hypothetical protein
MIYKNIVVGGILRAQKEEIKWRKLYKEELYSVHCSPDTVWVIIPRQDLQHG